VAVKNKVEISQNFVTFSEYMNFNFEISLPVKIHFLKAAFFVATIKLRKLRGDKIPVEELLYQFVLAKKRLRVLF
jgi:hypothetical protein